MSIAWRRMVGLEACGGERVSSSSSEEEERVGDDVSLALRSPNSTSWSISDGSRESKLNS